MTMIIVSHFIADRESIIYFDDIWYYIHIIDVKLKFDSKSEKDFSIYKETHRKANT